MNDPESERAHRSVTHAVDSIAVPPGPGRLRATAARPTGFPVFATLGTAAVLIAALAIAFMAGKNNAVTTSPTPSVAPPGFVPSSSVAPTASPSPSPAALLDDRFGFVLFANTDTVRSETDASTLSSFAAGGRSWTSLSRFVSPDGRFIAYWDPVGPGTVLKVRPAVGGSPRAVLTAASGMSGNTFAWSADGTGLAVAVDNNCQELCAAQGGTPIQELWTVDLATGATERVATGDYWIPVAWDRTTGLIAAGVTGPGGYLVGYDLIDLTKRPYTLRSTEFTPTVLGRFAASSDAHYVLLTYASNTANLTNSALAWWPLAEPAKRQEVPFDGYSAAWRPGTSEIWWVGGLTPAGCRVAPCSGSQLVSYDVASNARGSLQGSFGSDLLGFRVDGAAAITDFDTHNGVIVSDVKTGKSERVSLSAQYGGAVRLR